MPNYSSYGALADMFVNLFSYNELNRFLSEHVSNGEDLWRSIPHRSLADKDVAFEVVNGLRRSGQVGDALFVALCRERGKRADHICEVYELLFGKRLAWMTTSSDHGSFDIASVEDALGKPLVDLLGRCAASARAGGFDVINTTEVFRQYKLAQPWVRMVLGEDALPEIDVQPSDEFVDPFDCGLGFSRCTVLSIQGLARYTSRIETITEHELFFDLARFGAGSSVTNLRAAGGTITRINDLSRRLGVGRRTRHGLLEQ